MSHDTPQIKKDKNISAKAYSQEWQSKLEILCYNNLQGEQTNAQRSKKSRLNCRDGIPQSPRIATQENTELYVTIDILT